MKDREVYNDWEGFDSNLHVYDERKEKSYQARIWWCLGVVCLALSISLIVREIKDYRITRTCPYLKAEMKNEDYAVYMLDGVVHRYYLPAYAVRMDGDYVLLYYKNDPEYADAVSTLTSWLPHQLFFGGLTAFSGVKLWKIYKGKKHAEE